MSDREPLLGGQRPPVAHRLGLALIRADLERMDDALDAELVGRQAYEGQDARDDQKRRHDGES